MSGAKSFYDRYWNDEHIKINPFDHHPGEWTRENFEHHMKFFQPFITGKMLDFGCGEGQFCDLVSPYCASVTGIDISQKAVENARQRFPGLSFNVATPDAPLPFGDGSFDTITMLDVLEHILDIETMLEECHRLLKPGGKLLIATSEITRVKLMIITLFFMDKYFYPTTPHIRYFSRRSLADILRRKGFDVVGYCKNRTYLGFIPHGQMVAAQKR